MNRLTRISATIASSACLVAGFAGVAAANPSVGGNGNNSSSQVSQTASVDSTVDNTAHVSATNNNPQTARSGSSWSDDNYHADSASTGSAMNMAASTGTVGVDFGGSGSSVSPATSGGSGMGADSSSPVISDNGNNSSNTVTQKYEESTSVKNNADVKITNNNSQSAVSGDAHSSDNYSAGSVTTGSASNTSTNSFNVSVSY